MIALRASMLRLGSTLLAGVLALASSAGGADAQEIRIAWQPDPNVPLYIAREKQMFEAEGLKPTYVKFLAAPPMFAALQSASVDIADMGLAPAIVGKSQGIDIKLVVLGLDVSATNVLVAQKGQAIRSPKDLKGKRIGAQRGTTPYFGLVRYLEKDGLGINDVTFIDLTAPNIVPAFRRGELDAAWVWSPWQNMLVAMGGTPVTSNKEVGALAPQVWAVRAQWARENPHVLQKFLKVLDASFGLIDTNEDLAVRQLGETLNIEADVAKQVLKAVDYPNLKLQGTSHALSPITGYPDANAGLSRAVKQAADFLHVQGIIKTTVAPSDIIDPEPLKAYLK